MHRLSRRTTLAAIVVTALASGALAHDFWISPSDFRPEPESSIDVRMLVGEAFSGEGFARNTRHVERFVMRGPAGTNSVTGNAGSDPAGSVKVGPAGTYIIAFRSTRTRVELPADEFEAYLEHEGLDHVIRARRKSGTSDAPGREVFSRCAKSIVRVGKAGSDHASEAAGLRLELVPERDPYELAAGDTLVVRVLLDGRALPNALVTAHHTPGSEDVVQVRSDKHGRAALVLDRAGPWLLNTVHMLAAPMGVEADWESLWSSLTFDLAVARKRVPESRPSPGLSPAGSGATR